MTNVRKRTAAALAALGVVALGYALWRWEAGPRTDVIEVRRADLVQNVVASGRVESPRRVEVGSAITNTVVRVAVDEGQRVESGQLLVELDSSAERAAVEVARTALAQAEAKIAQLRETTLPLANEALRQAEVNLANAERQWQRSKDLFERGFVGQAALDDAQRNRDLARAQLQSAKVQRESEAPGGTDARLAQAALAQARANLIAAQARLELTTIEAPVAGTLIARSVEQGNVAQPGKVLLVLSPEGETQLVVQIDERNLNLLRIGQKALASADAFPGQRFAAELSYINPGVDAQRGSVEVKLRVPDPPAYLLQDMTVSVDIEVARRPAALALPIEAVHDLATAQPWVLVARDGHAVHQAVRLGARGDAKVEVLEGLAEGELVLSAGMIPVHEGSPVRARRIAAAGPP